MKNILRLGLLSMLVLMCVATWVTAQLPTKQQYVASPAQIRASCTIRQRTEFDEGMSRPLVRASALPVEQPKPSSNGKTASLSPVTLGSASNVFTILHTEQNKVFANDTLDVVGFVHRNNASIYGGTSGQLRYDVSIDGGSSFGNDIGVLNPVGTWEARFPNITIGNPIGNTNPFNSQLMSVGPGIDNTTWSGHYLSQSTLTSSGAPTISNETYDTISPGSFVSASSCEGHRGDLWKVASIAPSSGNLIIIRQYCTRIFIPPVIFQEYGTEIIIIKFGSIYVNPNIAFSPDGNVGWVALLASSSSTTDSVLSPILFKTTDMGQTWTAPTTVNLNSSPWIADSLRTLWVDSTGAPASDGIATTGFDFDLTVDVNGNPHMAVVIGSHVPGQPYAMATGLTKFLADVHSTDGGLTWDVDYVAPILTFRTPEYGSTSSTVSMDNYPQIARSEDGKYIFYSWVDSDTSVVTGNQSGVGFGESQNLAPNLRAAGLRVATGERTYPKLITDGDIIWEGRALFPTMAPTVRSTGNSCFQLPIVMAEMPNSEPTDPANFYYFGNDVNFCGNEFCDPASLTLSWDAFANTSPTSPCMILLPCDPVIEYPVSSGRSADNLGIISIGTADPHWVMTVQAGVTLATPSPAYAITPNPYWAGAPAGSAWIANSSASGINNRPSGTYEYKRDFNVIQADNNVQLVLDFLADDYGTVSINGTDVLSNSWPGYDLPVEHTVVLGGSVLHAGNNELKVRVENINVNPHGFALSAVLQSCDSTNGPVGFEDSIATTNVMARVQVRPNPTNGVLEIAGLPPHTQAMYVVTDLWGRTLFQSATPTLDVSGLSAGLYFLRVESKLGTAVLRFVKL
jgi:hypothetical protein